MEGKALRDNEIFDIYIDLIGFLEEIMGPDCEIVLQDLREPMRIVEIRNAHDPSRVKGGEVSEFAKLVMQEPERYNGINFVTNYKGKNALEYENMSTSTHLIRNPKSRIIGMLCINEGLGGYLKLQEAIESILRRKTKINIGDNSYSDDVLVDVSKIVDDGMRHLSTDPAEMSPEAKKMLVGNLSDRGIFLVRGAVAEVAKRLEVSEQTVYRYMKENQN